ncbi:beta-1,6-N-acetylglucosaminyltransferase [Acinetobacter variabilis]|uniref:beta-1,6-N-acetylglucosaminyltransferase n=1 Tax=Acinetobacter variabilis TaxID=70346 RepID=UPI003AF4C6E2
MDVHWGGYTQIEATLKLLNYASQFEYQYFSFLSGDDIPLMPIESIEKYLLNSDQEYIGYELQADPRSRVKYLYPDFFFIKEKSILEKIKCKLIIFLHKLGLYTQNIESLPKLYKGSLWFILSHQAVQYILDFIKNNKDYDLAFRKSLCADEVYFHTIIQNSYLQERIYHPEDEEQVSEGGLRYIDWMSGPDYPKILDESDFDKMKQSGMLFARKVKANIDIDLLKQYFQYS